MGLPGPGSASREPARSSRRTWLSPYAGIEVEMNPCPDLSSLWSSLRFAAPERFGVINLTAVDRFRRDHHVDDLMGDDVPADLRRGRTLVE